jgi:hypothetical protein
MADLKKKRILILSLGEKYGGAEIYTLNLLNFLPKDKYEIHIAVRKNGGLIKHVDSKNVLILDISKKHIIDSLEQLNRYIDNNQIDFLHCNGINAMALAFFASTKLRKIAVIHGDTYIDHLGMGFFKEKIFPKIEIFLINRFDSCIAVSK